MALIVDVYNVLHVVGDLGGFAASLSPGRLAARVAGSRFGSDRAVLVCDGAAPSDGPDVPLRTPTVRLEYAGPGRDADSEIERMIRESTSPRRLTVVSDDRRLRDAARRRRARSLGSEEFLRMLRADGRRAEAAPEPRPSGLSDSAVRRWMEEFGFADGDRPGGSGGPS